MLLLILTFRLCCLLVLVLLNYHLLSTHRLLMCATKRHSPAGPPLPLWKLDLLLQQHLPLGDTGKAVRLLHWACVLCQRICWHCFKSTLSVVFLISVSLYLCSFSAFPFLHGSDCSWQFAWRISARWPRKKQHGSFLMPSKFALTLKRYIPEASASGATPYGWQEQGNMCVAGFCQTDCLCYLGPRRKHQGKRAGCRPWAKSGTRVA